MFMTISLMPLSLHDEWLTCLFIIYFPKSPHPYKQHHCNLVSSSRAFGIFIYGKILKCPNHLYDHFPGFAFMLAFFPECPYVLIRYIVKTHQVGPYV